MGLLSCIEIISQPSVLPVIQSNMIELNIEIDRHFIKEKVESGLISTSYVSSCNQLANVLTKTSYYTISGINRQAGNGRYPLISLRGSVEDFLDLYC